MKNVTLLVILAVAVVLIVYDFWVGLTYGGDYTESWVILQLAHAYPAIPFAFGFLMGHLFATQHGDNTD
jgi:hypothetical protein